MHGTRLLKERMSASVRSGAGYKRIQQLEAKLESDRWDVETWNHLLAEAQKAPIEITREVFDKAIAVFPSAARVWKAYIEAEMTAKEADRVTDLFRRCLLSCLSVDLWLTYLVFVKQQHSTLEGRGEVLRAYEFAIEHVGQDFAATPLWLDYVQYLRALPADTPVEKTQHVAALRRVYHMALAVPMNQIETVWRMYEEFEAAQDKASSSDYVKRATTVYHQSRSVARERRAQYDPLPRMALPVPPASNPRALQQVEQWRRVLAFEKRNAQRVDADVLRTRITLAYGQCVMQMYHHPEFWLDFALYVQKARDLDAASAVFARGVIACPDSPLLVLSATELEAQRHNTDAARAVYERALSTARPHPSILLHYVRFEQRARGPVAARAAFVRVRKLPSCTHHVYVASAQLEHQLNRDPDAARRVFEMGMKPYANEPDFVLAYMDFLAALGDHNNVRAVAERALHALPRDRAQPIWTRYLAFEALCGDTAAVAKLQTRIAEEYPSLHSVHPASSLLDRLTVGDLLPATGPELDRLLVLTELPEDPRKRLGRWAEPGPTGTEAAGNGPQGPPLPRELLELMDGLPPAAAFAGAGPDINKLMEAIVHLTLPAEAMAAAETAWAQCRGQAVSDSDAMRA